MAITTKPIRVPNKYTGDRVLLGLLQTIADRVEKPRVTEVDALNIVISDPPTAAEVAAIGNKVNEVIAALKAANIMDSS